MRRAVRLVRLRPIPAARCQRRLLGGGHGNEHGHGQPAGKDLGPYGLGDFKQTGDGPGPYGHKREPDGFYRPYPPKEWNEPLDFDSQLMLKGSGGPGKQGDEFIIDYLDFNNTTFRSGLFRLLTVFGVLGAFGGAVALYHYTFRTRRDMPRNDEFTSPEVKDAIKNAAPTNKPPSTSKADRALQQARFADPYPDAFIVASIVIEQLQREFPTLSANSLEQLVHSQLKKIYPDLPQHVPIEDRATVLAPLLLEQIEKEAARAKAAGNVDNEGYGIIADLSATDAKRIVHEVISKYNKQIPVTQKLPPGHREAYYKYKEISEECNAWDEEWSKKVTYVLDCLAAFSPSSRNKPFEQLTRHDQLEELEIRRKLKEELVQLHEEWEAERLRRAQRNHELALATQDPKDYILRRFNPMPAPLFKPEDGKYEERRSFISRFVPEPMIELWKARNKPVPTMDEQLAILAKRLEEASKPTMTKTQVLVAADKLANDLLSGKALRPGAALRVKLMGPERQKISKLINY